MSGRDKIFLKEPKGQNYVTICFKMRFTIHLQKNGRNNYISIYIFQSITLTFTYYTVIKKRRRTTKSSSSRAAPLLSCGLNFSSIFRGGGEFYNNSTDRKIGKSPCIRHDFSSSYQIPVAFFIYYIIYII